MRSRHFLALFAVGLAVTAVACGPKETTSSSGGAAGVGGSGASAGASGTAGMAGSGAMPTSTTTGTPGPCPSDADGNCSMETAADLEVDPMMLPAFESLDPPDTDVDY